MNAIFDSAYALRARLDALLARNDLNGALALIQETVERIVAEPLCTASIFGDRMLDGYCQRIGAATLAATAAAMPKPATSSTKTQIYIATKLQKSGGHTRVIEDMVRSSPPGLTHVILSTELIGESDRQSIEDNLRGCAVTFEWNADADPLQKLRWLQKRLRDLSPENVWLFSHHQDSVAVAAVQPDQGYRLHFYHHGDYQFCLGIYLSYARHIDLHPMGYHICRHELGIADNIYLPLWVEDLGPRLKTQPFMPGGIMTTCTAAGANKVEIPYFASYIDMVAEILAVTGGKHVHLGRLTRLGLWKIRRAMSARGIDPARFIHKPWVPSVWSELLAQNVDLYIASFPYGGARTLIEAMGAGIPVTVHDHFATRLLGGADVAYGGAVAWREPAQLYAFLKKLTPDFLAAQGNAARAHFEAYHDAKLLAGFTTDKLTTAPPPLPLRPHTPDLLQGGFEAMRQMRFRDVMWRVAYRYRKTIKACLSFWG